MTFNCYSIHCVFKKEKKKGEENKSHFLSKNDILAKRDMIDSPIMDIIHQHGCTLSAAFEKSPQSAAENCSLLTASLIRFPDRIRSCSNWCGSSSSTLILFLFHGLM